MLWNIKKIVSSRFSKNDELVALEWRQDVHETIRQIELKGRLIANERVQSVSPEDLNLQREGLSDLLHTARREALDVTSLATRLPENLLDIAAAEELIGEYARLVHEVQVTFLSHLLHNDREVGDLEFVEESLSRLLLWQKSWKSIRFSVDDPNKPLYAERSRSSDDATHSSDVSREALRAFGSSAFLFLIMGVISIFTIFAVVSFNDPNSASKTLGERFSKWASLEPNRSSARAQLLTWGAFLPALLALPSVQLPERRLSVGQIGQNLYMKGVVVVSNIIIGCGALLLIPFTVPHKAYPAADAGLCVFVAIMAAALSSAVSGSWWDERSGDEARNRRMREIENSRAIEDLQGDASRRERLKVFGSTYLLYGLASFIVCLYLDIPKPFLWSMIFGLLGLLTAMFSRNVATRHRMSRSFSSGLDLFLYAFLFGALIASELLIISTSLAVVYHHAIVVILAILTFLYLQWLLYKKWSTSYRPLAAVTARRILAAEDKRVQRWRKVAEVRSREVSPTP